MKIFYICAVTSFIYIPLFVHVCSALLLSIAIIQVCVLRSPLCVADADISGSENQTSSSELSGINIILSM